MVFILGCEFYLSCWPFGENGSPKTFFSAYLAAPLFVADYFAYKVCLCQVPDPGSGAYDLKLYFKTKIVRPVEMDFTEAEYFDEEDRLNAIQAAQEQEQEKWTGKEAWIKRAKYMVFG